MIDSSIYGRLGQGVRSVADYDNEAIQTKQNALALMLNQQKADEYSRGVQEQNALRGWTPTGNDEADYASMRRISPAAAEAYRKSQLDARKTNADIDKTKGDTSSKALERKITAHNFHLQQLGSLTDPSQIDAWAAQGVKDGVLGMQESMKGAQMMKEYAAANGFDAAKQQALRGGMTAMQQLEADHKAATLKETGRHNVTTETETNRNNVATDTRVKSEGAANRGVTMRGQNMVDERTRELTGATKEAAAAAKKDATVDKEVTKFSGTLQKEGIPELEGAVSGAEGALGRYKKGDVPGVGAVKNALPAFMMSEEGKDVRQAVAQVRNIVLNARSGAAVTDQELRRLVEEIGTGAGMNEDDLRRGLKRVRDRIDLIKTNAAAGVSDDVLNTYKGRGGIDIQRGGTKPPAARTVVRTGTDASGKKVIQYSDGSIEHAN